MKRIITLTFSKPAVIKCLAIVLATFFLVNSYAGPNLTFIDGLDGDCENVKEGGEIGYSESDCGPFDPALIENLESPSGGDGDLEFLWLKATDPDLPWDEWTIISGADGDSYDPGFLTETTYFLRCSRRSGCNYYYGESNIIAKVVCPVDTHCPGGQLSLNKGYADHVTIDEGVSSEDEVLGAPDGKIAKFHDEYDYMAVKMDDEIKAGESIVVTWKYRDYSSSYSGPAELEIWCSKDGNNFTKETTLTTYVKSFLVSQAVTLSKDARYIKLKNGHGTPDFQVDAISYCQSTCEIVCDNITYGGRISGDEVNCGAYHAATITNLELPSGGSGTIEYFWLKTTDPSIPALQWDTAAIGAGVGPTLDPGLITETTYFIRCSRRYPCTEWIGESNAIAKVVVDNSAFRCEFGPGIPTWFNAGNGSSIDSDNGVVNPGNALGAPDGQVAELYDDYDFVQIDLGETLKAGEVYVISWKAKTQGFTANPAKLNILESTDNTNFTLAHSSETFVKYTMIHQTFTATKDVRYLKLQKASGFIEIEIDGISYCKAECPECDNVTGGGKISGNEVSCRAFYASDITNLELPSGGSGTIEYFWLKTTDPSIPALQWDTAAIGAGVGPTLDPGLITETTYFIRCSRRYPCTEWIGESNAIAKVVVDNSNFRCEFGPGIPTTFNSGNGSSIDSDNGVVNPGNALGAPDGQVAELYDDYDFVQIDLGETLKAGEVYVISWKAKTQGFTANPAKLNILESTDNTDFTLAHSSETFVKYTMIHETFTATKDVRYLKLQKASGFIEIEIDAISYCKAECPECDNVTDGGNISGDEVNCGAYHAATITNLELPSGGSGAIEYFWLKTTDPSIPALQWDTAAIGAGVGPTLDPGLITETTYFIRCSRRYPCTEWIGESNAIAKVVVDNSNFRCEFGPGTPTAFNAGNGSSIDSESGTVNAGNALGTADGLVAELYDDNDFVQIDLGETLEAGEVYVISWKGKTQGFTANPAKLNIFESEDNTNFTLAHSSETFVKFTMIHETFTASKDVRYLKLEKAAGFIEIEIDAISYCKAECPECDNVTDGGMISGDEVSCGAFHAATITNLELPSGGSGTIEYFWLKTTDPSIPALQWDTAAIGAGVGPTFDPGLITETTYFIRCARRYPCTEWIGESNAIAKVVVDNSAFRCEFGPGIPTAFNAGNGSSIDSDNGVVNPGNALGAPDGQVAELYDDYDFVQIDLGETLQAGEVYVISWKAKTQGFTVNPAKLNILESTDNTDFTLAHSSETFVKYTMIHETFTATKDVRYLKLQKAGGFIEIEIDAISYCKAECPECDNVTDGGKIGHDEFKCGPFDPGVIGNITLPSGGSGTIEYFWLKSTDPSIPALQWDTAAIGAGVGPTFDPGFITETTYFIRCARRYPCTEWIGESNVVAKVVIDNSNVCSGGNLISTTKGFGKYVEDENGADLETQALGAADGQVAELYDDNDFITLDLGETLEAGQTYVISWKAKTQGFTANPARLEIFESDDNTNFALNTTLETFVKFTMIHSSVTASQDVRYIKLLKSAGFIEIEIDAVSYCKTTCEFPTICDLKDHGKADKGDDDRLIWLKNTDNGEITEYSMNISDSRFTQLLDGSALLTGTAENIFDECDRWTYSVRLVNKRNWDEWSALGRSYKSNRNINNEDHTTWHYYELDENSSTFTGEGCNAGETLELSHKPSDFEFGFQVGVGANLKNGEFGISGWFNFWGSFEGHGDFNGNLDYCREESPLINIGDFVWEDLNGNGIQDAGEPGIQGVQAQLIGTDFAGNGVDVTVMTDENGAYNFGPLSPGTYKVIFSNLPGAYFATTKNAGIDPALDSDVDAITGMSPNKTYGGGQDDFDVDAGYIRFAEIGDFVWEDLNGNGIFDFGEPMIEDVPVNLTGTDSRGVVIDLNTTTNASGIYFFNGLFPGNYKLTFSPPAGYEATAKNIGPDPTIDSDIDPATNMTDPFELESGESDGNFDAGLLRRVNIAGIVFDDQNDDGLQDGGDLPVSGVTIELLRKDDMGVFQLYETDVTLSDGSFWFLNLPPAEYKISTDETTIPVDYVFSQKKDVGANLNDDIDNDANEMGMIEDIVIVSGQADVDNLGIGVLFNIILPVELIDFQAKVIPGNQSLLSWATETELNNKHFVIERSIDGQTFDAIGLVEGKGTTSNTQYYSFIDKTPFYGRNYYRLKQVDYDGQFDISEVRSVVIEADLPDAIFYPNPTRNFTTMRVVSPFIAEATLEIVSLTGQILHTEIIPMGTNSMDIDLSEYQAGVYFLNISYDGYKRMVHRVTKIQD